MFRCEACGAEVTTAACGLCGWSPEMTWRRVWGLVYALVYWRGYRRIRGLILGR